MNLIEVDRALRQLRLGGMASAVEARVREAQTEQLPHLDLIARLITDELHASAPTACSTGVSRRLASATVSARWTASISTSTRR